MKDYEERVFVETTELGDKIIRLHQFLFSADSRKVDSNERDRLVNQSYAMTKYYETLIWRIENFED